MLEILLVCTGNVCRSPLAALMLESRLPADRVRVISRGTRALRDEPVTAETARIAASRDIPAELTAAHRARQLDDADLATPDLVLALGRDHRREVVERNPARLRTAFLLREFASLATSVSDTDLGAAADAAGADPTARLSALLARLALVRGELDPRTPSTWRMSSTLSARRVRLRRDGAPARPGTRPGRADRRARAGSCGHAGERRSRCARIDPTRLREACMELRDYIHVLRKNWLIIVVMTLVGVGAAAAFSLTRTPMYQATSTVFVSTQASGSVSELLQGNNFSEARVTTYVNLVKTPVVVNPVIAQLGIDTTADKLAGMITASSPLNTTLIQISVENADPVRAADIANALGASLTTVVGSLETPPGSNTSPIKLTRVRDALPSSTPVSPNIPLNLALGALVGLAIGIAIAVLRTVLDNKVRTPRDVEQITDRPIIGGIPYDPKAAERPIILESDPHNMRSEAFRTLRTNLQFLEMDGGNSFVITSSVPTEGKSTTSVNLAVALADAGKRVALLDTTCASRRSRSISASRAAWA